MTVSDDELAATLASEAGRRLLALRGEGGDAKALRDAGDRLSHEFLTSELARLRPGDAVLSEEGADDPARLSANRVWIVDPLDGTREYGEPGRTDWAVHVALWADGELTAGAVALPAQGTVLSTANPPRRHPDGSAGGTDDVPSTASGMPLRLLVSRSRPPEFVTDLAASLDAVLVPMGSAGAKAAAVIDGQADAYVHSGGQYEWDSAAPVAVARAAGLHASRIDGSDLQYNQANPSVPDILICPIGFAATLLGAIARSRTVQPAGLAGPGRTVTQ
ncbi:MAG TPA: 3'(2'),5'-bisphosphate nucleotidase CysQ [Streptosporangiaceae bacterium]|nr:3'(2'),5'-bisphosphate nucleotidase CysQ [Streptosporangiaceae bacterium]